MKERPILFSGEMVRAILDGRKTQTRRVIKPLTKMLDPDHPVDGVVKLGLDLEPFQNEEFDGPSDYKQWWRWREWSCDWHPIGQCPYGQIGDRLWVRETCWINTYEHCACYRSDGEMPEHMVKAHAKWRPSIHMPRWASRILLEITDVRVERVQEISEEDAQSEGITEKSYKTDEGHWLVDDAGRFSDSFTCLWDSINAKRGFGWDANPWVWVVEFKVVS